MVHGHLREEKGTVILPIGRSRSDTGKMAVRGRAAARDAVTHFQLEEQLADCALVRCRLETGRARIRFAYICAPLGIRSLAIRCTGSKRNATNCRISFWHAQHLAFTHPKTKRTDGICIRTAQTLFLLGETKSKVDREQQRRRKNDHPMFRKGTGGYIMNCN